MIWSNSNITPQVGGNCPPHSAFFERHSSVKFAAFILQNAFCWPTILAKNMAQKQAIGRRFLSYGLLFQSIFKNITCILHHFAFLFGRQLANFSPPITPFQTLKPHFLITILPFFVLFFMVLRGFIYAVAVDIYASCLAFSIKKHCIQHHFTLRFAPKRIAFSTKTRCIQHQNAGHLAPKRTIFSGKLPQKWCKRCFVEINIHFASISNKPLLTLKQTSARIEFLRLGEQLVDKNGTFCVKFLTEKWTNGRLARRRVEE